MKTVIVVIGSGLMGGKPGIQHERESLRRLEGLQHHEERQSDRVREHRIGLRIPVGAGDHGIGEVRVG